MSIRCLSTQLALLFAGISIFSFSGCDAPATSPPVSAVTPPAASGGQTDSTPQAAPAPAEAAFASVQDGVAAFQQACAAGDSDQIDQTMRWLIKQGDAAVGPLGKLTNDPSADLGTRVAAARVLAIINTPAATEQLLMASRDPEPLVRVKAAESLGSIRPATSPMLDRLLELLDDEDPKVQSTAIRSLQRLGPQAERASPKLEAILNSDAPEQLRQQAHAALKKIAPRVGFRQGELDE